jgi:HK97 gp10 family phage protein
MSDQVKVSLVGNRDVIAALTDLRAYLPKTALRSAVRQAAKIMAELVQQLARLRTGKLRSNIAVRVTRRKDGVHARVIVNTQGKADNPKNAFYWKFLEKGFHTRDGRALKFPFVSIAFEGRKKQAAQQVFDALEKAFKRAEQKAKARGIV